MEPGILFGTVKSTKDPDGLGRIQVEVAVSGKKLLMPWLRLVSPPAHYYLPENGQEVVILCGSGLNPDSMVILGVTFHGQAKPAVVDGDDKNNLKTILTRGKTDITIDDTKGSEKLTIKTDTAIEIILDKKAQSITITAKKDITVNCENITVNTKKNATIKADGDVTVESAKNVKVKGGSKVDVEAGTALTVKGSSGATLDGGAKVDIKGGQINIG